MGGLDVSRRVGIVVQRAAEIAHRRLQHGVGDIHPGPQTIEQFLLGDQSPGTREHVLQQRECLGRERYRLVAAVELAATIVEAVIAKRQLFGGHVLTESSLFSHRQFTASAPRRRL
jgi:hypothetical protein